jgi:ABC-2 type transport system permease protein
VTGFIFTLTLRQLIGRKSSFLFLGLALLPLLIAVILRLSDTTEDPERLAARMLMVNLIVTTVLPLTALFQGTSVLGDELEDGTIVHLLTKPIARWQILLPKIAAAWLVTSGYCVLSTLIAGAIAFHGVTSLVLGFTVAVLFGSLGYCAFFVLMSLITSRALISGLVYVFIWEGALTGIFQGLRYLSIRHYTLGLAGWIGQIDPNIYDAYVGGVTAAIMLAAVTLVFVLWANRRLQEVEVREPS